MYHFKREAIDFGYQLIVSFERRVQSFKSFHGKSRKKRERKLVVPEVFGPPADAHQVLGGDLAAVRLLVEAGERLQGVEHDLAGRGSAGGRGLRTGVLEEVIARTYTQKIKAFYYTLHVQLQEIRNLKLV